MSGVNPTGIPYDGQASIALGPNQTMAVVWSGLTGTNTRPSGDIFLQLSDSDGSKAPVQLTQDVPADSAPQAAFDKNGRLVIAWQRNPSTNLPADISGLTPFAKGFEIAYAIFDPKTTNVLSTGLMTTNSDFDFSPDLFASEQGDVMLAWQRTDGESLSGSAEHPLSLHSALWNGTSWGPTETVITNLTGTYGWSGALASPNEAAIAICLDLDSLMATDKDREIGLILRTNGVWMPLQRLTTNNLPDVGPQLTYLPDHRLALGWLQGDQVIGLAGDMKAAPRTWIRPNDLLGQGFLQAQLIANGTNLFAVWPCARDLYALRIPLDDAAPLDPAPQPLKFGQEDVETTFTARLLDDGSIRYGALSTEIIRGITPQLAPTSSVITETVTFVQPGTGPRIVSVTSPTNGKVLLSWESITGRVYVIQRSDNLTTWVDATEFTASANLSRIDTDASSTGNARFFRLLLKP
jgi:hypothetical protein